MRVAGREIPGWVIVAAIAGGTVAAVWAAQYQHAARQREGAPDWLRAGQPPDVPVWQLPAALAAAQAGADGAGEGDRVRSWPPAWTPMTGGAPPAWSWAGASDVDGPQ